MGTGLGFPGAGGVGGAGGFAGIGGGLGGGQVRLWWLGLGSELKLRS